MFVEKLSVRNFRNLKKVDIELNKNINIFYGDNAQGKTSILESIYFCSTGRSHKTHIDKDVINFETDNSHLRVTVCNDTISDRIDVHLVKGKNIKKGIAVNNIPVRKIGELFGILHIVLFAPEDLQLIKAGPSERRRFMDLEMCQLSKVYYYDLRQYCKVLKQRNNLLKELQKNQRNREKTDTLKETLIVWDMQLLDFGKKIIAQRKKFVKDISDIASDIHSRITGDKEKLEIIYKPNVLEDEFEKKLERNIEKDILYGTTGTGPHKDDLTFMINGFDARNYGSQGQQRRAALSGKLAEIEIIKKEKGSEPVLLLDDVLSELDEKRQSFLLESIRNIQVIITCTGIEEITKKASGDISIFFVEDGVIVTEQQHCC